MIGPARDTLPVQHQGQETAITIPAISAIIVTHNSEQFIESCLFSVFGQERGSPEVIVVDNGSKDGTVDIIKKSFKGVILIENAANLGAAEARNQGIKLAKGRWILLLDCDTVLEDNFICSIIKIIDGLPSDVGMLQPKILHFNKETIYSCGIHLAWSRRFYDIGSGKHDKGSFSVPREIFGPCAAAALYRRKALEEIKEDTGYFDRRFFFLVEDVDLAWRSRRRRWKCLFVPGSVCYHKGNSSKLDAKLRQFLNFRNRLLMIKKNEGILYLAKILPLALYDLPRFFCLFVINPFLRKNLFRGGFRKNEAYNVPA